MILNRSLGGLLLVALVAAAASIGLGQGERRVALVIGNAEYEHVGRLANPGNDADAVSAKLGELGFSVAKIVDASLAETRNALAAFQRDSAGADIALIFYAGHGVQVSGQNYLLPVDALVDSPEAIFQVSLRVAEMQEALAAARPSLAVLILDACRDNPFLDEIGGAAGLASGSAFGGGFGSREDAAGVVIAFAAAPGAVAADGVDGNSPFTTALLQWIDRPGLEVSTMFRRVRQTVVDLTDGAQVPWVEEALLSDVYLNPGDPAQLAAARGEPFETALLSTIRQIEHPTERRAAFTFYNRLVPGSDDAEALEMQAIQAALGAEDAFMQHSLIWLSIRESEDPAIFEAFLATFPGSAFVDLARIRLAALGGPGAAQPQADPPSVAEAVGLVEPLVLQTVVPVVPDAAAGLAPPREVGVLHPAPTADPALSRADALAPPEVETTLGLDAASMAAVQRLLAELGHYRGPLDGMIGPMSRRAIEAFQTAAGLPATGYLDHASLLHLVRQAAPSVLGAGAGEMRPVIHGLAAVAQNGAGARPVVVRFESILRHPPVQAYWRELADAFEAARPGVMIEMYTRPDAEYRHALLGMLGSETPPDIFYTYGGGHLRAVSEAGFARDLTDAMAEGWAMRFKPGALENLTVDGRIYAVPFHITLVSLWVNAPLLEAHGIERASLETWSGFLAAVDRLRSAGVTPLAAGGAERWPLQFYWGSLAHRLGGREAFEAAMAGEGEGFAAPSFVEAGRLVRELTDRHPFQPDFMDMTALETWDAFAAGEVAMILEGSWALPRMTRMWPGGRVHGVANIARVDFPPRDVGGSGEEVTYGGVPAWMIRRDAPEQAVEFLEVLTSLEAQIRSASMGYDVPILAGADNAIEDPLLSDTAAKLARTSHHQLVYDMALGPVAGEAVNDIVVALVNGDLTPEQAAAEVQRAWERARGDAGAAPGLILQEPAPAQ